MKDLLLMSDVDGVLADFTGAVLEYINNYCGTSFVHAHVTDWSYKKALGLPDHVWNACVKHITSPGFAYGLELLPGGVELKELVRDGLPCELLFCTSPWWSSQTWQHDRGKWLMKHFGKEHGRSVMQGHQKFYVTGKQGTFFVDDKLEALKDWSNAQHARRAPEPWQALLWDAPYNAGHVDVPRVSTFETVLERML